jgi:two-component system chemotaxis response regulator CheY
MTKKVALVGHCGPDSSFLRMAVSSADRTLQIIMVDDSDDMCKVLSSGVDLLLLNRELGYGFDETMGVEVIRSLRSKYPNVKMMLVSNYADAQAAAIQAGALPGFGKREIGSARVPAMIREALELPTSASSSTAR